VNKIRIIPVALFTALLFGLLVIRFYQIQIVQGEHWKKIALSQHQTTETIPFMRGSFYSNTTVKRGHPEDKQPFVMDVQKFHLYVDPDSIPPYAKPKMARALCALLGWDAADLPWVEGELQRKSRSRKLAIWLEAAKVKEMEAWWKPFYKREKIVRNAIYFVSDYQRSYPFGSMLGTVLHTVQEGKDAEGQAFPTGGLEMLFNEYLKGKKGKKLLMRSPNHPIDGGKILEPAENGADVYLTVNHYLQAIVESELMKGVQKAGAIGGWAVMMDPYSGEILALAQVPTFNPARYRDYYNDPSLIETTKVKVVTDCFEPGSIFKPITMAICLKASEELVRMGKPPLLLPEEWIPCSNGWFPGRVTPLKEARIHAFLNLDVAMQKSSNIYMAKAIQRVINTMGDAWYRKALTDGFGFGKKTGIELPAESVGLVPTPGKLHPNGKLEWSVPTPYSLAIGHNILVNSLQLVRSYAILANGGYDVTPHIIRKIVKQGVPLVDNTAPKKGEQVLSPQIAGRIVQAMKFVTKEGGTSRRADVLGYSEVGKSGTAEKVIDGNYAKQQNISSFVGFTPAQNPRFVLLVSVDEPEVKIVEGVKHQFGGVCAAPIFSEIATRALQYLGVEPDDPYGYGPGDPRSNLERADMAIEIKQLKKEYEVHNR
jgi:cell division protein FtsI (penicillin-binding protein 3)